VLDPRTGESQAADLGYVVGCTGGLVKGAPEMSVAPLGGQDPIAGREARSGGRIAQNETAIMAGNNRIMIFGPKSDGTYVVEFRTAAGETLAISIPSSEAAVVRYFQERMPYGLFVPDLQEPK
jgi:hypothetical protein